MTEATSHHYIPALGNIYSAVDEYAEPILRIALGAILIPHGLQKLFGAFGGMGFAGNAALFDRIGFTPGIFWGTLVGCTELIGGILLVLGLFTRFAAAGVTAAGAAGFAACACTGSGVIEIAAAATASDPMNAHR